MKIAVILAAALLTGGCTHVFDIIDNQDIETSHLRLDHARPVDTRMVTIDGARRLIRSRYADQSWTVCAETQADAISSRTARTDMDLTGRGTLSDTVAQALTTTYTRTELSDAVRQLAWQVCNNRANGYLTNEQVDAAMSALINGTMLTLQLRASADVAALDKARAQIAKLTATLKAVEECYGEADDEKKKAACKAQAAS